MVAFAKKEVETSLAGQDILGEDGVKTLRTYLGDQGALFSQEFFLSDGDDLTVWTDWVDGKSDVLYVFETADGELIGGYRKQAIDVILPSTDPDAFLFSLTDPADPF